MNASTENALREICSVHFGGTKPLHEKPQLVRNPDRRAVDQPTWVMIRTMSKPEIMSCDAARDHRAIAIYTLLAQLCTERVTA
jgi:hypothetical protein